MATFKGCFFVLFLFPLVVAGQLNYKLDDKKIIHYINDLSLPKIVKEFYNGQLKASDDDETFILLDTLTSKNDYFFPFYFSIFNKIANESDGALSEVMGGYCFKILYHYPKEVFNFLSENKSYIKLYAMFLGAELYFKDCGTSDLSLNYSQFFEYLGKNLNLNDKRIKTVFDDFNIQVKEEMKYMNKN